MKISSQTKLFNTINKIYFTQAFPKINITLKIDEKIGNLHTLKSRFCLVKDIMYDSMFIIKESLQKAPSSKELLETQSNKPLHNKPKCYIYGNFDCKLEDNLIYKAYNQLLQYIDSNIEPCIIHIIIDKKIPIGGGLGGGSVNAALTLLILNELFNLNCDKTTLYKHAKILGSDVSFFFMIYTQDSTHIAPYFYVEQNLNKKDLEHILTTFQQKYYTKKDFGNLDIKDISITTNNKNINARFIESLEQKRLQHPIRFLSANVFGTGEKIEPFYEKLPQFLIHCNKIACNTAAVYKEFDTLKSKNKKTINIDLNQDSITLLKKYNMHELNDLYEPANILYNLDSIAKGLYSKYNNVYFSGSGSSFFSIKQL